MRRGLLCFFCALPLFAEPGQIRPTNLWEDVAYRPVAGREGYVQAWNVNVRSGARRIYLTYVVSNLGPGDLNSGVVVLLYDETTGQSRSHTAEFAEEDLEGRPGVFGHASGYNYIYPVPEGLRVFVKMPGKVELDLVFSDLRPGVAISGGPFRCTRNDGDFFRADIPVAHANVRGTLQVNGETSRDIRGTGGLEYLRTNCSPDVYARSFSLMRTYEDRNGLYAGLMDPAPGARPGGGFDRYAWMERGRVRRSGLIVAVETSESRRAPISGYDVPMLREMRTQDGCTIEERKLQFAGGYSVLANVSRILRWFLHAFFAKPYVLHYDARIILRCPDGVTAEFPNGQSTHYFLNE